MFDIFTMKLHNHLEYERFAGLCHERSMQVNLEHLYHNNVIQFMEICFDFFLNLKNTEHFDSFNKISIFF